MNNIWKEIKGYEGIYQISINGDIKRLRRNISHWRGGVMELPEKMLKISIDKNGYNYIRFCVNRNARAYKVHVLVARAFLPNPLKKPFVNHIDGNKTNNKVSNLEWCTQSENEKHAHRIGLKNHKGEKHPNSTLTDGLVLKVREMYENQGLSQREIGRRVGMNYKTVNKIVHRQRWAHI